MTLKLVNFVLFAILMCVLCSHCFVAAIVNKSNSKNITSINENNIYKPPLDPSFGTEEAVNPKKSYNGPQFCGKVPVVRNAVSNIHSDDERRILVNSFVTYSCTNGYRKVSGSEKLNCYISKTTSTPVWETPTLKCEIVDCGDPGFVDHANRHAFKFTFNETVVFTCDSGYHAEGPPVIICTANGRWNRAKPKCKLIQCRRFQVKDENMVIEYSNNSLVNGTIANLKCKRGFRLSEEVRFPICQWSGSWSTDTLPQCVRNQCSRPNKPHHAMRIIPMKEKYKIQESIMMHCLTGEKLKVSAYCTDDGVWSRQPPHCPAPKISHCPPVSELPHGTHNGSKGNQPIGTKIFFKCHTNYLLQGVPWIFCKPDGQWTGKVPFCVLSDGLSKKENTSSPLTVLLTCIIITSILILVTLTVLLFRWRQRQLQKRHWRRYFGNYTHRQSKTNIYHNNQEMKLFKQSKSQAVPVTDL